MPRSRQGWLHCTARSSARLAEAGAADLVRAVEDRRLGVMSGAMKSTAAARRAR